MQTRRSLLATAAAAAAAGLLDGLSGCSVLEDREVYTQTPTTRPAQYKHHPYVDVHCHVFNASDLPLEGFTREVLLREHGFLKGFVFSIGNVFGALQANAVGACAELASLPGVLSYAPADVAALRGIDIQNMKTFLYAISRGAGWKSVLGIVGGDQDLKSDPIYPILLSLSRRKPLRLEDCERAAEDIFADANKGEGQQKLTWLIKFSRSRYQLLYELDTLADAAGAVDRFRIFTPAIVDYDYWLDLGPRDLNDMPGTCSPPSHNGQPRRHSVVSEQVMVLSEIARRQPPGRAVFGFVPFDPLRAILEDKTVHGNGALDVVKDAIEHRGFAGVKLYPPMGFWPIGNGSRLPGDLTWQNAQEYFGAHVTGRQKMRLTYRTPQAFGDALDDALLTLYEYCLANDVPIMTHCSKSQYTFHLAAYRAAPLAWKDLLDRDDGHFRQLRLNLAHFGGPWCLGFEKTKQTANKDLYDLCEMHGPQWADDAMNLLRKTDASGGAYYSNLYFDIADWNDILTDKDGTADAFAAIKAAVAVNPLIAQRLMYGTDWNLLGQYGDIQGYAGNLYKLFFASLGSQQAGDIMGCNALRFLGLIGDCSAQAPFASPTRDRLGRFLGNGEKWAEITGYLDKICVPDSVALANPA